MTGNGHMRHYVKSNTHIRQHIYFTANALHYKAQRSITMLNYIQRDMKRTMLKMCEKSTAFIHSVMRTCEHTHVLYFTSKYVVVIAADLK